jgi:DNA polymerase elongation subunit (family B)
MSGMSVQVDVCDFFNYVVIEYPYSVSYDMKTILDKACKTQATVWKSHPNEKYRKQHGPYVAKTRAFSATPIMGYNVGKVPKTFLAIYLYNLNTSIYVLKEQLKFGIMLFGGEVLQTTTIYDQNDYVLQFMIETGLKACTWIRITSPTYTNSVGSCQICVECNTSAIIGDTQNIEVAPLRLLSFDIETYGNRVDANGKSIFSDPEFDPIITICGKLYTYGFDNCEFSFGYQLKECDLDSEYHVRWFETEEELLKCFCQTIDQIDPDLLVSYNGTQFDLPYIIKRMTQLGLKNRLGKDGTEARCYNSSGSTIKTSHRKETKVIINGRINWDVYPIVFKNEMKLRSYKLNNVAIEFIGDQKLDVSYMEINRRFRGSSVDRKVIVDYCMKDSVLPYLISQSKLYLTRYIEMARVTGTIIEWLVHKGQAIKASQQIRRMARKEGFVIPYQKSVVADEQFKGAVVIEPQRGFYSNPVSTLDFNSLYPSIMIAHNLSYETFVGPTVLGGVSDSLYKTSPCGHSFVTSQAAQGIISRLLKELLDARKAAKRDMATADSEWKRNVYDGRQLALKMSANSIYGFTGATTAGMPMKEISESVTAYGREMIMESKRIAESSFAGAQVVYGDSVVGSCPVICKNTKGDILIVPIESLFDFDDFAVNSNDGKYYSLPPNDITQVWSDRGFTEIKYVMRHHSNKRLVRVTTHTGSVVVTEDHSLIGKDGSVFAAKEVSAEDELLHMDMPFCTNSVDEHLPAFAMGLFYADGSCGIYGKSLSTYTWAIANQNLDFLNEAKDDLEGHEECGFKILNTMGSTRAYKLVATKYPKRIVSKWRELFYYKKTKQVPQIILNSKAEVREAFMRGYYAGDGDKSGAYRLSNKGEVGTQGLFFLLSSLGKPVSVNTRVDKLDVYTLTSSWKNRPLQRPIDRVKKIEWMTIPTDEAVYDIETENHHFAAGVGRIVVHNTDSIMTYWGPNVSIDQAEQHSRDLCKLINERFPPPCNIEFEKTYCPYLLIAKKRYAGKRYEGGKAFLSTSGLETARRDNCPIVPRVMNGALQLMLMENNWKQALEYAKGEQQKLIKGQADITELIITNELKNDPSTYKVKNAVANLVERMQKRDPSTAPKPGDRVPHVIIKAGKGIKKTELAEDPLYVVKHKIELDYVMYNETQLAKPLYRIFQFFPGVTERMFMGGAHLQYTAPSSQPIGGLMGKMLVQYSN